MTIVLSAKPGITGMWQVSGRSEVNFDKRIKMDADYVKQRSLILDITILLKSPWAMISGAARCKFIIDKEPHSLQNAYYGR